MTPYWFPAKRFGWGWGPPVTWQGWLVIAVYVALIVAAAFAFPPRALPAQFVGCIVGLSVLLTIVCWITGEPPRWRSGK